MLIFLLLFQLREVYAIENDSEYWINRFRVIPPPYVPVEEHMQDREPDTAEYPPGVDSKFRRYVIRIQQNEVGHWMIWQQYLDQPEKH